MTDIHNPLVTTPPTPTGTPVATPPSSTRAITALILGIFSLLCCGFITGVPAIILGRSEMKAVDRGLSPQSNRTLGLLGFVLGIIGTIISCLSLLAYLAIIFFGILGSVPELSNHF